MGRTTFPPCHGADRACAHHSCFIIHCCLANLNQLLRFAASCELSRDTRCSTDQRIKEDQHTLGQRAKPARAPAATPGSLEVKSPGTNENAVRPRPAPHYVQHRHGAATRGLCKLHTRKAARRRLTAGFRSPGAPAADRSRRRPPGRGRPGTWMCPRKRRRRKTGRLGASTRPSGSRGWQSGAGAWRRWWRWRRRELRVGAGNRPSISSRLEFATAEDGWGWYYRKERGLWRPVDMKWTEPHPGTKKSDYAPLF